jgi:hypothetical protein
VLRILVEPPAGPGRWISLLSIVPVVPAFHVVETIGARGGVELEHSAVALRLGVVDERPDPGSKFGTSDFRTGAFGVIGHGGDRAEVFETGK